MTHTHCLFTAAVILRAVLSSNPLSVAQLQLPSHQSNPSPEGACRLAEESTWRSVRTTARTERQYCRLITHTHTLYLVMHTTYMLSLTLNHIIRRLPTPLGGVGKAVGRMGFATIALQLRVILTTKKLMQLQNLPAASASEL